MHIQVSIRRDTFESLIKKHAEESAPEPRDVSTLVAGQPNIASSVTKAEMHFQIEDVKLLELDAVEAPYSRPDGSVGTTTRDRLGVEARVKTWLHVESTVEDSPAAQVPLDDVLVTYRLPVTVPRPGLVRIQPTYISYRIDGSNDLSQATKPVIEDEFRNHEIKPVDFESKTLLDAVGLSIANHPLRNASAEPKNLQEESGDAYVALRFQFAPVTKDYFRFFVPAGYGAPPPNQNCAVTISSDAVETVMKGRLAEGVRAEVPGLDEDVEVTARWADRKEFAPPHVLGIPDFSNPLLGPWSEHGVMGSLSGKIPEHESGFPVSIKTDYYARFRWKAWPPQMRPEGDVDGLEVLVKYKVSRDLGWPHDYVAASATVAKKTWEWLTDKVGSAVESTGDALGVVDSEEGGGGEDDEKSMSLTIPMTVTTKFGTFTPQSCTTALLPKDEREWWQGLWFAQPAVPSPTPLMGLPSEGHLQISGDLTTN